MTTASDKVDVFAEPIFDNSIISLEEHTYKPYGSPAFKNSDEIRIPVHFQDIILDISESYIYIEGRFTPKDETKECYLSNNALAFLFNEIRYEMGGEQVAVVRKPGITTLLKTLVSYTPAQQKSYDVVGWGLDKNNQPILDKTSHIFCGKLPLKHLMGFAEDYTKGIFNVKQELILIIARTFCNSYEGECDADIKIDKIEWKIRHIIPDDGHKLKMMSRMSKGVNINVAYRKWDLYELPALRETSSDIWAIRTSTSLERPRYIIFGFQPNTECDSKDGNATQLSNAGISDIRLYLNSTVFPYERWNLDIPKNLYAPAYNAYENFQKSYYGRDRAEVSDSYKQFMGNPIYIIDCSHQAEAIKSSTVDVKIEFQTRETKFPANTRVYALVIHDSFLTYNTLNGSVKIKSVL